MYNRYMEKRRIVLLGTVLTLLAVCAITAIIFAMNRPSEPATQQPTSVNVKGNVTCLPHKNVEPDQPQTLECALGLKAEDGTYYGLTGASNQITSTPMDKKVQVGGTITNPDSNNVYDIKGSIKVETFTVE
jgi:hypothetical protein